MLSLIQYAIAAAVALKQSGPTTAIGMYLVCPILVIGECAPRAGRELPEHAGNRYILTN